MHLDIFDQLPVFRTVRSFNDFRGQNGIHKNFFIFPQCIHSEVQTIYFEGTFCRIKITDSNPVFCNLIRFVPIFDFQPLSLMNRPENVPANLIHTMLRPVLHDISIIHYDVRTEPLSSKSSIPLAAQRITSCFKKLIVIYACAVFVVVHTALPDFSIFFFLFRCVLRKMFWSCGNRICIRSYKHR